MALVCAERDVAAVSPIANSFRSGPSLELEMEGFGAAAARLRDAAARGEDMRPAMQRVRLVLIEGHKEQFDSHGSHLGTLWPENSPETLARKAREGVPSLGGLMVNEGSLREALAGGAGSRSRVGKGSVSVGVSLISGLFAQGGASGNRRGVEPARPVVGIGEQEKQTSLGILTDFLIGPP